MSSLCALMTRRMINVYASAWPLTDARTGDVIRMARARTVYVWTALSLIQMCRLKMMFVCMNLADISFYR